MAASFGQHKPGEDIVIKGNASAPSCKTVADCGMRPPIWGAQKCKEIVDHRLQRDILQAIHITPEAMTCQNAETHPLFHKQ